VISTPFASGAGAARVEVGAACRPYPPLGDDRRRAVRARADRGASLGEDVL